MIIELDTSIYDYKIIKNIINNFKNINIKIIDNIIKLEGNNLDLYNILDEYIYIYNEEN